MSNFDSVYTRLLGEHRIDMMCLNNQLDRHIENEIKLATNMNKAIEYMENYINIEPDNGTTTPIKIEFKYVIKILKEDKDYV